MYLKGDRTAWLEGGKALCKNPGVPPPRAWHLLLLGPPGAGKGTLADKLVARYGVCHLSTGDVFRAAIKNSATASPALQTALAAMKRGDLVSDDTVVNIVRERTQCLMCDHGFLLDGFPRTVEQAQALDFILAELGLALDAVVLMVMKDELIVQRLSGRRVCRKCNAISHVDDRPPKVAGVCDKCGGEVYQREDDRPETIAVRLQTYHRTADPVMEYYRSKGLLWECDGKGVTLAVFEMICPRLDALLEGRPA
jgi:adenylate kinase